VTDWLLSMSVADNLVLILRDERRLLDAAPAPQRRRGERSQASEGLRHPTTSTREKVSALSGGNQQKVIVARELSRPLAFLVASQPPEDSTWDRLSTLHRQIVNQRNEG